MTRSGLVFGLLLALMIFQSGSSGCLGAGKPKPAANTALLEANRLSVQKKYSQAVDKYKRAIAAEPKNPACYHMYGRTLALMGLTVEAVEQYRLALKLAPNNAELYNDIGVALVYSQQIPDGARFLKRAVELSPRYISAYNNLGAALKRLGAYRQAKEAFVASLRLQPTNQVIQKMLRTANERLESSVKFDFGPPVGPDTALAPPQDETETASEDQSSTAQIPSSHSDAGAAGDTSAGSQTGSRQNTQTSTSHQASPPEGSTSKRGNLDAESIDGSKPHAAVSPHTTHPVSSPETGGSTVKTDRQARTPDHHQDRTSVDQHRQSSAQPGQHQPPHASAGSTAGSVRTSGAGESARSDSQEKGPATHHPTPGTIEQAAEHGTSAHGRDDNHAGAGHGSAGDGHADAHAAAGHGSADAGRSDAHAGAGHGSSGDGHSDSHPGAGHGNAGDGHADAHPGAGHGSAGDGHADAHAGTGHTSAGDGHDEAHPGAGHNGGPSSSD